MMRKAAQEVERRLYLLSGLLFAGNRLGMWCYSGEQKLFYSTSPYWEELQMFLKVSTILDQLTALGSGDTDTVPKIYSDEFGMIWIGERVNVKDGGSLFILCGPVFLHKNSRDEVLAKLDALDLSVAMRLKYARLLGEISVLEVPSLRTVYLQLHFAIYDEYLPEDTFELAPGGAGRGDAGRFLRGHAAAPGVAVGLTASAAPSSRPDQPEGQTGAALLDSMSDGSRESADVMVADYGKMKQNETALLNCVRAGIFEGADPGERKPAATGSSAHDKTTGGGNIDHYYGNIVDYGLEDELRSMKDSIVIFMDKCTDAAIESGVPIVTAKGMQKEAIQRLEESRTIADAAGVNWQTFLDFVAAVHKTKQDTQSGISRAVQQTMDYIRCHYSEEISLQDLADLAGYSEYYLSRKFTKETGLKIQDYIRDVRMQMAKILLTSTTRGITDIALSLQYKSRSHFDRTFTSCVGISPAQYRAGQQIHKEE